jgi:hypothetical protein
MKLGIVLGVVWSVLWGTLTCIGFGWPLWHIPLAFFSFVVTWYFLERNS